MDGIGSESWGEMKAFYAIGIQQSDLQVQIANACHVLKVELIPDMLINAQLLQRSDAFEFAQHGIPFVYGIGLPGDMAEVGARFGPWLRDTTHYEYDKIGPSWNWHGVQKYAQFFTILGMSIANKTESPAWEPSSPFRRPRR